MTLKCGMALILRYFTEFGIVSRAHCVKVVRKKFTFAISSPDEFLVIIGCQSSNRAKKPYKKNT